MVRALGPSLANFGITDPLLDPVLELRDGNGDLVAMNDNWETDPPPDNFSVEVTAADLLQATPVNPPFSPISPTAFTRPL